MRKCCKFLLLAALPLLPGCLQIELQGPVAGARVTITPLGGGTPIARDLASSTVQQARQDVGGQKWENINDSGKAAFLGLVELPEGDYLDNAYYLVTASGGTDMDGNGDGRIDAGGVAVERDLHAIMSGTQLKQPFNRVNMLSEAIYRVLEPNLGELSNIEIGRSLNALARIVVGDVNRDKLRNYKDVLRWSHFSGKDQYKGSPEFLQRLPRALTSTLYSDEIAKYDSFNAVAAASLRPARANAPRQAQLAGCTFPVIYADLCTVGTLPLIGIEEPAPTVADIMARLVVSDPWISKRFEQVLAIMPADILLLFRSVTAVVIGTDIRPSFYDPLTGALYLDAEYFWLTDSERSTISTAADFRAEFVSKVKFAHLWRYVDGNTDAFTPLYQADLLGRRRLEDIELNVARLLLHELAHAADAFRPTLLDLIPLNATLYELSFTAVSDELQQSSPLQSDLLASMANVLFHGVEPTFQEANYSAANIGSAFAPDPAADLYSYSSQYEDLAMLFEEAMMAVLYSVRRDVAFTSIPATGFTDEIYCEDLQVAWGMRGRITARQVLDRAKLVVAALLPERDYAGALDPLDKPLLLNSGTDWCSSIVAGDGARFAPLQQLRRSVSPRQLAAPGWH
jgi:hypothetical protein